MPVDFSLNAWLRWVMDEDEVELLKVLFTHIGMEMVEAGDEALRLGGPASAFDPTEIAELDRSISKVTALLHAVRTMRL